jgi:hypothetical protein
MENQGPTNALASGVQNNFNVTINAEDLSALLASLPDAVAMLFEMAGDYLQLPPDLDVKGLIYRLAEFITPADGIPWLVRAAEIARQHATDSDVRAALGASVDQWAAGAPGVQGGLDDFRTTLKPGGDSASEPCLLIALNGDRSGGYGYQMSIVVFRNGRDGDPQPSDDSLLSLTDVRRRLRECLPPLIRTLNADSLLVEFVVPRDLLSTDFDQWRIPERPGGAEGRSYPIGVRHAVVVRDIERMSPLDDRSTWRARWHRLCTYNVPVDGAVRWVGPEDAHDYSSLVASLSRQHAGGQVCLALSSALSERSLSDLLEAGLCAGVPAAIWLRQPVSGDDDGDEPYLARLVDSIVLHKLPRKILDLRQEAEEERRGREHQGRRLGLLWDDPNRTWAPPPFSVPAPSLNGADE